MPVQVSASAAKISRPKISGIYPRTRLFSELDSHQQKSMIWITSPPGSGKTTLISSYLETNQYTTLWYQVDEGDADVSTFFYYMGLAAKKVTPRKRKKLPLLTPEYQRLSTFARNYFNELYSRFTKPFVLVFDNYHDATAETELHRLIAASVEQLPEYGRIIVISREAPPCEYSRLRANGRLIVIDWNKLRLTEDEMGEILSIKGISNLSVKNVMDITRGWMAGLVLLFEHDSKEWPDKNIEFNHELLFDYFAGEIFNSADEDIKKFLIKTALFPKMTVNMATQLTGIKKSAAILDSLVNKNYFTYRHGGKNKTYEYHPLFREFLIEKAEEITGDMELTVTRWNAAELLYKDNQIESAIQLIEKIEDWKKLTELIKTSAKHLLDYGRHHTLREWLAKLPEAEFVNDPWLLYWYGECNLEFAPAESWPAYEKAYRLFQDNKDISGIYLAWAGIVESIRRDHAGDIKRLDRWIEILDELTAKYPEFPSADIEIQVASSMFTALWWRMPQHQDLFTWRERVLDVADQIPQGPRYKFITNMIMAFYLLFTGQPAKAKYLIDICQKDLPEGYINPHSLSWFYVANALYYWRSGNYEQCFSHVEKGLEFSDKSGSYIEDYQLCSIGASAALTIEDLKLADKYIRLTDYCDHGIKASRYHYIRAWYAYLEGDLDKAGLYAEKAVKFAENSGAPFFIGLAYHELACILFAKGERKNAREKLTRFSGIAENLNSDLFIYHKTMTEALFAFEDGNTGFGMKQLASALFLGRERGLIGATFIKKSQIGKMCIKAMESGIETDYVVTTIQKMNLLPGDLPYHLDNWPWKYRIYSFDHCELYRDEKKISFGRKPPKKLMELIASLVAFGGGDISDQKIIEALWPDVEADAGQQNLATTLHRLRKIFGNEAIQLTEGRLSINPAKVWVDVWAFEKLIYMIDKKSVDEYTKEDGKLAEKALGLYRGHFLANNSGAHWAIPMREKLRNKFIRCVEKYGTVLENSIEYERAIFWYQRGLEIDLFVELFYQRLMACYEKLDRKSDAVETYRQCYRILSNNLKVEPSRKTKEIYTRLRT